MPPKNRQSGRRDIAKEKPNGIRQVRPGIPDVMLERMDIMERLRGLKPICKKEAHESIMSGIDLIATPTFSGTDKIKVMKKKKPTDEK